MHNRVDEAIKLFKEGYGCAQATIMAVADLLPVSIEYLADVAAAFGGGFARLRGNCGAVSAIGMAVGFLAPKTGNIEKDKAKVYEDTRVLIDKFTEKHATINCAELLKALKNVDSRPTPEKRSDEYYSSRPCVAFVVDAVEIIEDYAKSIENRG